MEELLRAYAPVTMARLVKDDMEFERLPDEGRRLGPAVVPRRPTATPSASSEPTRSSSTARSTATRRSASASTAALGSHLARMELRVALEVWLERFPDFSLADPDAVTWSAGQVRGPRMLPVAIDR